MQEDFESLYDAISDRDFSLLFQTPKPLDYESQGESFLDKESARVPKLED